MVSIIASGFVALASVALCFVGFPTGDSDSAARFDADFGKVLFSIGDRIILVREAEKNRYSRHGDEDAKRLRKRSNAPPPPPPLKFTKIFDMRANFALCEKPARATGVFARIPCYVRLSAPLFRGKRIYS